jgi:hypothetical protein
VELAKRKLFKSFQRFKTFKARYVSGSVKLFQVFQSFKGLGEWKIRDEH